MSFFCQTNLMIEPILLSLDLLFGVFNHIDKYISSSDLNFNRP